MRIGSIKTRSRHAMPQMILLTAVLLFAFPSVSPSALQKPAQPQTASAVVDEWFKRWNALDGTAGTTAKLLELYLPEALHQTSPSERQSGTVLFTGHENIRKMAEDFGKRNTAISFRVEVFTLKEKTASLYHVTDTPWGGTSVAAEYVGVYTVRETKKRFMQPGAVFFDIENGKIRRARFYAVRDETAEVVGS
jgi:hypothetical protein